MFCRYDSPCDQTMARAKTPFLFVQFRRQKTKSRSKPRDSSASLCVARRRRHLHDRATFLRAYINGSIVGKGRGQSEPQVNIRVGERLPLVPLRNRPGRRPRCGPFPAEDRIGPRLLDSRRNPVGRRQRDGGDDARLGRHDCRSARRTEFPVDFHYERRSSDRRNEGRVAGVPLRRRPEDGRPGVCSQNRPRTRRPSGRCIRNDSSARGTSRLEGPRETLIRARSARGRNLCHQRLEIRRSE